MARRLLIAALLVVAALLAWQWYWEHVPVSELPSTRDASEEGDEDSGLIRVGEGYVPPPRHTPRPH